MIEKIVTIKNKLGLHARPAALFVQTAAKFSSQIKIIKDGQEVDGKSIMGLMTLAAAFNTQLKLLANGSDENEAINELVGIFENGFGE
ncbi:MAG: HPr family phosphocarrier protein [Endomicrobiales bacterium]|nr:HPr family phosphocarrier protein [Endomicrobiales bacterium]